MVLRSVAETPTTAMLDCAMSGFVKSRNWSQSQLLTLLTPRQERRGGAANPSRCEKGNMVEVTKGEK